MKEKDKVEKENLEEKPVEPGEPIVIEETMVPIKNPDVTIREEMEGDGKYVLFKGYCQ